MKTKLFLTGVAIVSLLMSGESYAMKAMILPEGGHVGNGGGVVVCRNTTDASMISSVELLDYYEARALHNAKLDLDSLTGTWQERAQQLINRLNSVSPFRVDLYSRWLSTFEKESLFMDNVQFSNIPDTGFIAVPDGCEFAQGLVQRAPRFSGDKRYFVNNAFWKVMDDSQRAGIVLHEFLYREAMGYGHTDSISVRHLNGVIADAGFAQKSQNDWIDLLIQARYEMTDVDTGGVKMTSTVDTEKMWAPAPKETADAIVMINRLPIYLGICGGEGCSHFGNTFPHEKELFYLHPMLTSIGYEGYDISTAGQYLNAEANHTSIEKMDHWQNTLSLFISNGKIENIFASGVFDGNQSHVFQVTNKKQGIDFAASTATFLSKDNQTYLVTANALSYSSHKLVMTTPARGQVVSLCAFVELVFTPSGLVNFVSPGLAEFDGCDDRLSPMFQGEFISGNMKVLYSRKEAGITFSPETGFYDDGGILSLISFNDSGRMYICMGEEQKCMRKVHVNSSNQYIEWIEILSPTWATQLSGSGDSTRILYTMSAGQKVALYPNGVAQSVIVADHESLQKKDGTWVSFKAGDRVNFDEEGYVQ